MRRLLKSLIPLPARMILKTLGYRVMDIAAPIKTPRVPPRAMTSIGGGDFAAVGNSFFTLLKETGLTAEMNVLDVGCGQGRMARPMTGWLTGAYHGFDIDKSAIDWCKAHYQDVPHFHFDHADIFNARYNLGGAMAAADYKFPYEDASFDRVFLTSVFTHMLQDDVKNYLAEIARVMKPGSVCLITSFLHEKGLPPHPIYDFHYQVDEVSRTTVAENPEAAIAFNMDWMKTQFAANGLGITSIDRGEWAGGHSRIGIQDLIIARKT